MSLSGDTPAVGYRPIDRTQRSDVSLDEQLPHDHPVRDLRDFTGHLAAEGPETQASFVAQTREAPGPWFPKDWSLMLTARTDRIAPEA